jgi:hypothetical protein
MASKAKAKKVAGADDVTAKDLSAIGLQSFKMENIHRNIIKNASYNPRTLSDAAKAKLKKGLARHGLVAPLTWNRRSGNLVGGHQRISQLDDLAGTDNYTLDVAVIDVEEGREKEINILLNNGAAQGEWDLEALSALLKDSSVEFEGTGFDHADVYRMFGDDVVLNRDDPLDELAVKVREARDKYNEISNKAAAADDGEFYIVVVFRDQNQVTEFLTKHKLPDNRYQSAEELMDKMK